MSVIQNKWIEKERKKKVIDKPVADSRDMNEPIKPYLNVARANYTRSLRGVRK